MEALLGEHENKYYKAVYDEIQILIKIEICNIFTRNSADNHKNLPFKSSFKYNRKHDCSLNKFKVHYFVRGCVHKRLSY